MKHFGGNPSKVAFFDPSAGGSSVGLHLLSPLSEDLFHQAVVERGVELTGQQCQLKSQYISPKKILKNSTVNLGKTKE